MPAHPWRSARGAPLSFAERNGGKNSSNSFEVSSVNYSKVFTPVDYGGTPAPARWWIRGRPVFPYLKTPTPLFRATYQCTFYTKWLSRGVPDLNCGTEQQGCHRQAVHRVTIQTNWSVSPSKVRRRGISCNFTAANSLASPRPLLRFLPYPSLRGRKSIQPVLSVLSCHFRPVEFSMLWGDRGPTR